MQTIQNPVIVVVDPQRAFIDPSMEGDADTLRAFDSIQVLRSHAEKAGIPLIIAQLTEGENVLGTAGDLMMSPRAPTEHVVQKTTQSTFGSKKEGENTAFSALLDELGAKSLIICGYKTSDCVYRTAVDSSQKGYATFVVGDAISGGKPLEVAGYTPDVADFKDMERQFVEMFIAAPNRAVISTKEASELMGNARLTGAMTPKPGARAGDTTPQGDDRPIPARAAQPPNPRTGM